MTTLSREALAHALEYWTRLPYGLQLEAILECSIRNHWDAKAALGEVRHWLTMVSSKEQLEQWGVSLFGYDPAISEHDGELCMQVVEFAWMNRPG